MKYINPFRTLAEILQTVRYLEKGQVTIMAKIDDLQAVLDSIPPVLDAISADEGNLMAEITALRDQIAGGGVVTAAQMQKALDSATAIKTRLDAIDTTV